MSISEGNNQVSIKHRMSRSNSFKVSAIGCSLLRTDRVLNKPTLSKEVTPNSPQERFRVFLKIPNRYLL